MANTIKYLSLDGLKYFVENRLPYHLDYDANSYTLFLKNKKKDFTFSEVVLPFGDIATVSSTVDSLAYFSRVQADDATYTEVATSKESMLAFKGGTNISTTVSNGVITINNDYTHPSIKTEHTESDVLNATHGSTITGVIVGVSTATDGHVTGVTKRNIKLPSETSLSATSSTATATDNSVTLVKDISVSAHKITISKLSGIATETYVNKVAEDLNDVSDRVSTLETFKNTALQYTGTVTTASTAASATAVSNTNTATGAFKKISNAGYIKINNTVTEVLAGDAIIYDGSSWNLIQSNLDLIKTATDSIGYVKSVGQTLGTKSTVNSLPTGTHNTWVPIAYEDGKAYSYSYNISNWGSITDKPTTMKNPYPLNIAGISYDGSATQTVSFTDDDYITISESSGTVAVSHNTQTSSGTYGTPSASTITGDGEEKTIIVPQFTVDGAGHITTATSNQIKITVPANTDEKVKDSLTTNSIYYIVGSTSSAATTGNLVKRANVFVDAKGILNSGSSATCASSATVTHVGTMVITVNDAISTSEINALFTA